MNPLQPVVTICTTSLTCNNSTFCPHRVLMCFVWIGEQTTIISLHSMNWLVFITDMQSIYCAVRTEYTIWFSINLGRVDHSSRGVLPSVVCPMSVIVNPLRGPWPGIGSKRHKGEKNMDLRTKSYYFPVQHLHIQFLKQRRSVFTARHALSPYMQVFKWWSLIAEARFRSLASSCEICGGRSSKEAVFCPRTSVFPCQYYSPRP